MRTTHLRIDSEPRAAASFGRIARSVATPWHGAIAASANDDDMRAAAAGAVRPDVQPLLAAARARRDRLVGDAVVALLRLAGDRLRAWRDRVRQAARARAAYRALAELDARTLHDIGLTGSELRSAAPGLDARVSPVRTEYR